MNSLRIKSLNWVAVAAMLALAGPLATSCSKDTNTTEVVENKDNKLRISVLGINNGASLPAKSARAGSSTSSAVKPTIHSFSDVDVAVVVDNNLPVKASNLSIRNAANGLSTAEGLRAEAVAEGVKYVLYLYEGDTFVKSVVLTSGIEGTIEGLNPDTEYTWVALSYNSVEDVPASSPTAPSVDLPANTDVLYASGTVTVSENPTVGITFDHVYSRIGIELNTIGVFGEMTATPAVSVSGLNLASGTLNLLTGALSPGAEVAYDEELHGALTFEDVDPAYSDQKIAYLYTAPLSSAQNFTVSVQGLTIEHADGGLSRTYFASPGAFSFAITPQAGQSHHALLNIVESPLTGPGGVRWGRSNLYYRGDNGGLRNYAFYSENRQTSRGDGYFGFGATIPGVFATTSTQGDPCALVYPQGLWKTPSNADLNALVNGSLELGQLESILGIDGVLGSVVNGLLSLLGLNTAAPNSSVGSDPYVYAQYALGSQVGVPTSGSNAFGSASHPSNNLRFYYNGQITGATVLPAIGNGGGLLNVGLSELSADLAGVNLVGTSIPILPSYGAHAAFWTNTQAADLLNLGATNLGAWSYFGLTQDRTLATDRIIAQRTAELLNGVSALGVDVLSTSMKNVRCVRNPDYQP